MSDRELEQYMKLLALNLLALTAVLLKLMEGEERFSWFKLKEPRKKITTPEVKRAQNEKAKKEEN
mgnify:CR=1 FL=1